MITKADPGTAKQMLTQRDKNIYRVNKENQDWKEDNITFTWETGKEKANVETKKVKKL